MTTLVTGSAGHLGEALMRKLRAQASASDRPPIGLDIKASAYTTLQGSIDDAACVAHAMKGVKRVFHAATLHKPHIATHSNQDFINTNIIGTLNLLEAARVEKVEAFIFTSTTSVFGDALKSAEGEPAGWITEQTIPQVKNIYGATKLAAEDLCRLYHRNHGLNCLTLRTSRFFPEDDDDREKRASYSGENSKANEFLYRRVDIEDAVEAHFCAANRAAEIDYDHFIISATTPFEKADRDALGIDAVSVVEQRFVKQKAIYAQRNYRLLPRLDRVYVNAHARKTLGWQPRWDFAAVLKRLEAGAPISSQLAREVGAKGYHSEIFADGPYPTLDEPR